MTMASLSTSDAIHDWRHINATPDELQAIAAEGKAAARAAGIGGDSDPDPPYSDSARKYAWLGAYQSEKRRMFENRRWREWLG